MVSFEAFFFQRAKTRSEKTLALLATQRFYSDFFLFFCFFCFEQKVAPWGGAIRRSARSAGEAARAALAAEIPEREADAPRREREQRPRRVLERSFLRGKRSERDDSRLGLLVFSNEPSQAVADAGHDRVSLYQHAARRHALFDAESRWVGEVRTARDGSLALRAPVSLAWSRDGDLAVGDLDDDDPVFKALLFEFGARETNEYCSFLPRVWRKKKKKNRKIRRRSTGRRHADPRTRDGRDVRFSFGF